MRILKTYWRQLYIVLLGLMLAFYPNFVSDGMSKTGQQNSFAFNNSNKIIGIDISKHNGEIDWIKLCQNESDKPKFVFIKATEGLEYVDSRFKYNWSNAKKNGIYKGAYHFFLIDMDPKLQAYNFISHVWPTKGDLPPVLDFETLQLRNLPVEYVKERLKIWLRTVEKSMGLKPIIYTNEGLYKRYIKSHFDDYPIWISDYTSTNLQSLHKKELVFWQYSASGSLPGINSPVDLNVFLGSAHKFEKYLIH